MVKSRKFFGLTAALVLTAFAANVPAGLKMTAQSNSYEVYGCSGRLLPSSLGTFMVGYVDTAACNGTLYSQSNAIWAFRLPELPAGKVVKNAVFWVYYVKCYGTEVAPRFGPTESLYGIDYRAGSIESPITPADHFVGAFGTDYRAGYFPIQANIVSSYAVWQKWFSTDAGAATLSEFLNAQFENGAQAGDWVMLRQSPEYIMTKTTRETFATPEYTGYYGDQEPGTYTPYIEYELGDGEVSSEPDPNSLPDPNIKAPELKPGLSRVDAPIEHQPYYMHERELFGYNPRFEISSVEFGPGNKPYIRGEKAVLTLDGQGRWLKLNYADRIKQAYPSWNGQWVLFGPASEDRIVFDDANDAYMLVNPAGIGYVLMYSRDLCRTWKLYKLPDEVQEVRFEFRDSFNDKSKPPVILTRTLRPTGGANYLKIFAPMKSSNGILSVPAGVRVTGISIVGNGLNPGKGASNLTVTKGDKTHIFFSGRYFEGADRGTPQYVVTYDHVTKAVTPTNEQSPIYLGSAGDPCLAETDGHNWPAATIDSDGYIHVILGAHGPDNGQCFKYVKSLQPNSSAGGWTAPVDINPGGFTYPSLLCGKDNIMHLVARDYWDPRVMKLKHQAMPVGGWWGARQELVRPWDAQNYYFAPYSHYAAKLSMDKKGRMFLCYWNQRRLYIVFDQLQFDAYNAKFPFDNGDDMTYWHDGAMLMSDDNGTSWRLALTEDFVNGIDR